MPARKEKVNKTEQVGFKVESDIFLELEAAAWSEKRPRNQLARLLFEWGFAKYKEAGSFEALMGRRSRNGDKHG